MNQPVNDLQSHFQVLIPFCQRPSLDEVLSALLQIDLVQSVIVIGDALNSCPAERIKHLPFATQPFVKASYLNHGLLQAESGWLLISDADILWNRETLREFLAYLSEYPQGIGFVSTVRETVESTQSLQRPRWQARLGQEAGSFCLSISEEQHKPDFRPGCGLIAAHRDTLLALGGYNESLQGWGWEDQDLLLRAQILGYPIQVMGSVLHLSHGDNLRNQGYGETPMATRDRNIVISCQALARGECYGSLAKHPALAPPVQIRLPPVLQDLACPRAESGRKIVGEKSLSSPA